jgi:hypothetical protein
MALVIAAAIIVAFGSLIQGVYILRTGFLAPFFTSHEGVSTRLTLTRRLSYSLVYLFPGVAIVSILIAAINRRGEALRWWATNHLGMLFWITVFGLIGLWLLFRPASVIRSLRRSRPEIPDDLATRLLTRIIGAAFVLFAIVVLTKL